MPDVCGSPVPGNMLSMIQIGVWVNPHSATSVLISTTSVLGFLAISKNGGSRVVNINVSLSEPARYPQLHSEKA